jgi:hypothetical protein
MAFKQMKQSFWTNPKNAHKVEQYKINKQLKSFSRNAMTADQLTQSFLKDLNKKGGR